VQSDNLLLGDIAAGSSEALGRLYDAHAPVVFGLARRILRAGGGSNEDAEEVVQDVFAQVWREAARYEASRATVAGWLVMLTRTRAIDRLRKRRARPDLAQPVDPAPVLAFQPASDRSPEAAAVNADEARRIGAAMTALSDEQRQFLDFAYYEGLSQSEIAERTGTPLGTVKTRMRTALQTLRAALTT
jgi:RNA polymerase sigma-70 factor (ECF subfamily)